MGTLLVSPSIHIFYVCNLNYIIDRDEERMHYPILFNTNALYAQLVVKNIYWLKIEAAFVIIFLLLRENISVCSVF